MTIAGLFAQSSPRERPGARAEVLGSAAGQERDCGARSRRRAIARRPPRRTKRSDVSTRSRAGSRKTCSRAGTTSRRSARKRLAELRAAVAADPARASAQDAPADGRGVRCGRERRSGTAATRDPRARRENRQRGERAGPARGDRAAGRGAGRSGRRFSPARSR